MTNVFRAEAAIRAALLITGSTYFTYLTGLVVGAVIARQLGPDDYGRYAYLVWMVSVFVLIATNGLTITGIRFVSEALGRNSPAQAAAVHGWLLRRQLIVLAVTMVSLVALSSYLLPSGWGYGPVFFVVLVLIAGAGKTIYLFQVSIAKGYGEFSIEAYSVVALSIINVIGVLLLYWNEAGLPAYCGLFAAVSLGYLLWSAWLLKKTAIRSQSAVIDNALLTRLQPHLLWSVLFALAAAFSNKTIETYALNVFTDAAQVGFFVIAATLTRSGVDVVATGLNTVLMPMMAHGFGAGGKARVDQLLSDALRYFQFLGLMVAGVGYFWAAPLVQIIYGTAYESAVPILQVMVVVAGVALTEGVVGALLSTTDNQRLRASFVAISVVVSLVAALALVPAFGLIGAAVSHSISHLVVACAGLYFANRLATGRLPWRALGKLFGCALVVGLAIQLLIHSLDVPVGQLKHVVQIVAGILFATVLLATARWIQYWQERDASAIESAMARLPVRLSFVRRLLTSYFATQRPV